jgi:hypothetical protein
VVPSSIPIFFRFNLSGTPHPGYGCRCDFSASLLCHSIHRLMCRSLKALVNARRLKSKRLSSEVVIDVRRARVKVSGDGKGDQCGGIGVAGQCTDSNGAGGGKGASSEERSLWRLRLRPGYIVAGAVRS